MSVSSVSQVEGDELVVTAQLLEALTAAAEVSYSIADDSAVAGTDYVTQSGTLTFAPGETMKTIRIATVEDAVPENTESFTINLAVVSGDIELENSSVVATIADDDNASVFSVADGSVGAIAGTPAYFNVLRLNGDENSYTIDYATSAGTAVPGTDYTESNGTITFEPGQLVQTIEVPTLDLGGSGGTFTITLSNPSNGAVIDGATSVGNVQIINILASGTTVLGPNTSSFDIQKIEAGHPVVLTLQAGQGGSVDEPGGKGGKGVFSFYPSTRFLLADFGR